MWQCKRILDRAFHVERGDNVGVNRDIPLRGVEGPREAACHGDFLDI
jgi:hypothetical protein